MGKIGTSSLLVFFLLLLGGTGLMLGYQVFLEKDIPYSWAYMMAVCLLLGVFSGVLMRKGGGKWGRLFALIILSGALGGFVHALLPTFKAAYSERDFGPYPEYQAFIWAAIVLLVSLLTGLSGRSKKIKDDSLLILDKDAKAYIEKNELFLSKAELEALNQKPGGLVCQICKTPYRGTEGDDGNWLPQWVRCHLVADHVFHAFHFKNNQWRCPVDKSLMYDQNKEK